MVTKQVVNRMERQGGRFFDVVIKKAGAKGIANTGEMGKDRSLMFLGRYYKYEHIFRLLRCMFFLAQHCSWRNRQIN
jgi:hypothetical protein